MATARRRRARRKDEHARRLIVVSSRLSRSQRTAITGQRPEVRILPLEPLYKPLRCSSFSSWKAPVSREMPAELPAERGRRKQFVRILPRLPDYSLTAKIRCVHSPQRGEQRATEISDVSPAQRSVLLAG
jgi:hypothetical protein